MGGMNNKLSMKFAKLRHIPAQAFLHLKHDVPKDVEDEMMNSFAVARDYSTCVASLAGSRHALDQRNFLPNALQLETVDVTQACDYKSQFFVKIFSTLF